MLLFALSIWLAPPNIQKPESDRPMERISSVTDIRGKVYNLRSSKLNVFVFISADCPISNRYAPEISRIAKDYSAKQVALFTVYVEKRITLEQASKHRKEFKLTIPALFDPGRRLIEQLGATTTPEAIVLDGMGQRVYRGRIDDAWAGHGQPKTTDFRADLRIALNEYLSGAAVSVPETPPLGCTIPK